MKKLLPAIILLFCFNVFAYSDNNSDAKGYFYSGLHKANAGDYKGAIEDYTKAIELDPNLADAYMGRGFAKAQIGDNEGATEDKKIAAEIENNEKEHKTAVIKSQSTNSLSGSTWTEATDNAAFKKRFAHTSVVFNNKIWVIGGTGSGNNLDNFNDVWYSNNGIDWIKATGNAKFSPRAYHSSIVYDNKMWVIAGLDMYIDSVGKGKGESGIFDSKNLAMYSYAGLNPLKYLDPDGNYYRDAAVAYANQWVLNRNSFYAMREDNLYNDCTNYVSQCLNAGGIETRTNWFNGPGEFKWNGNKENACYSPNWTTAQGLASWLRNDSDILAGEFRITPETTPDEINNAISGGGIAKGDLLGWSTSKNGEDIHHFGIISDIKDGQIYFNEHTNDYKGKPLNAKSFGPGDKSITVFHIKEDAK